MSKFRIALGFGASIIALSCGSDGPTGSGQPSGSQIIVVQGASGNDTVWTELRDTLVVEVRNQGAPAANYEVWLRALSPIPEPSYTVLGFKPPRFSGLPGWNYFGHAADTTDASGRVRVAVVLGYLAGVIQAEISVPALGLKDTIAYTVVPGNPDSIHVSPDDTATHLGRGYTLTATVRDRWGNARGEKPTLANESPAVATLNATSGHVQSVSLGRTAFTATYNGLTTRAFLSVVPQGRVSYFERDMYGVPHRLAWSDLDGSNVRSVAIPPGYTPRTSPSWNVGGDRVAFSARTANREGIAVIMDTLGNVQEKLVNQLHIVYAVHWRGDWLYIGADAADNRYQWLRSQGTFATADTLFLTDHCALGTLSSAPAHDRVAYDCNHESFVRPVGGSATLLKSYGLSPQWSPDGAWIGFGITGDGFYLVRPDGSGERKIFDDGDHATLYQWSPDGAWALYNRGHGNSAFLIRISDGLSIPLPTGRHRDLLWRP